MRSEELSDQDWSDITTAFFESRWFRRMWVILEYIQCDVVHLLSSDFRIPRLEKFKDNPVTSEGSFSFLWDLFITFKDRWKFSRLRGGYSRQQVRQFVQGGRSTIFYAHAFSIIASKECAVH
jgi:hypothetical protein